MTVRLVLLITALISSGLVAGLFFGWSVSVIPGTSVVDDRTYILTMQNINREIINPPFLASFLLTPAVLAIAAVVSWRAGHTRQATTLGIATATYLFGVLTVTAAGNVPLNDALDAFAYEHATDTEAAGRRRSYETRWNRWHNLRTVASVATLALTAIACTIGDGE